MSESCKRCGRSCLLARGNAINGSTQIFWWCTSCGRVADPQRPFVRKDYVTHVLRISIESLPVVERFDTSTAPVCAVCGQPGVEYHHWAPRHLFADAELWPGDYLCAKHHRHWHDVVTPLMCYPNGHMPERTTAEEEP